MTSKSKKNKIKQGNLRDFDLLYDTLLSGGTYSDYRSELLDRSMPQEMPLVITEDDILAAWILGKDEESELYARGGHIHQDQPWMLNPNNKGIGQLQKDLNQNSFTSGTSESDYTPTGLYSSDSGHNYTAGIPFVQQFDSLGGLGFNVAANANGASNDPYAKFIMGDTSGGFLQLMMSQKSSLREGANYIKSLELNFGVGDNAYLAQQYNQMQPIARSTMDADAVDKWKWIFDPSGIMHSWGLIDYDASEGLDYLNLIAEQVENRNKQNFNTAVTNSNKLNLWNQLSQPYMAACGGKMKNKLASGGYINSHYDYITDPLVKVDAGGTHQENPNEGVLTSIAPDGEPNLVEEGETIINNGQEDAYVFSDRIVADEEILKSHLLPVKFAGKTYADISKELDKIIEEHKNDEISKRTFDEMISRLQQAQEDQKYQEKAEEVAKFIDGLSDEEKEQLEQTMVEEAQAEQQAAEEQAIAEQQAQELVAAEQGMPELAPEQAPEQVVMEQPEELIVPSRYDQMMSRALFADAANSGMFGRGGHLHQTQGNLITATKPVYGPEGNIIGYETPQPTQWIPENEPALLNADNRTWLERTGDQWNTWWNNRPSPEFAWAARHLTPLGIVDAVLTGDTDLLLANAMPGGRNGIWKKSGGTRDVYTSPKGQKVISDSRKSTNATNYRYQTQNQAAAQRTAQNNAATRIRSELMGLAAESEMRNRSIQDGLTYEKPIANEYDYRYSMDNPDMYDYFSGIDPTKVPNTEKWYNNPGPKWVKGAVIGEGALAGGVGTYGLITELSNGNTTDKSENQIINNTNVGNLGVNIPDYESYFDRRRKLNSNIDQSTQDTSSNNATTSQNQNVTNHTVTNTGRGSTRRNNSVLSSGQEPYSNPHRPDYSIFGQYIPNRLTPYEVDGNFLGYTDPFGRFVPIGGYSDYGDTVNSIVNETNTSNTNTNSPNTKSKAGYDEDKPNSDNTTTDWSTYLRYAPAIGSGIQYLSDLFGVTNRNDYTNPNLFQRSINLIPNVGFTPIGGYRTFNPFDETYQQNALRSMNEAARRAVINNANGNYGAALAALNALNYNTGSQFGDLALKAREYNDKERQAIDEYNLKINQINSTLSMTAQEKNQAIAALKARLTATLALMRQQIEDTNDAAKSANMTNFYLNLGNVGKENFNMTMVRSNPAFYYTITNDGHILYKNGFDGLNERDQAFVRSVAEPQAEEQHKKHLEEANKKADLTTNKQSDYGLLIGGRNPFSRYGSFGNFGNY